MILDSLLSRKSILFPMFILFLSSCDNSCDEDLVGKFYNLASVKEEHYIELKKDSTYVHFYKDSSAKIHSHSGNWKFVRDECELVLINWTSFGKFLTPCDSCIKIVQISGKELLFSYDLKSFIPPLPLVCD